MQEPSSVVELTGSRLPPPDGLREAGAALWRSLQHHYRVEDAQGVELLALACRCRDRAADAEALLLSEGYTVNGSRGPMAHPAIKILANAESVMLRALRELRLPLPDPYK